MRRKAAKRRFHSEGYVMLPGGKHGRYEHKVIAESMLGRPLGQNEVVHHIDGNKNNNRSENLRVLTYEEHNQLHHGRRVKANCGNCGRGLHVWPYRVRYSKSGKVFCSSHCFGLFNAGNGVKGRPFTKTEDSMILNLRKAGWAWNKIGKHLSRDRGSIRIRAKKIGAYQ